MKHHLGVETAEGTGMNMQVCALRASTRSLPIKSLRRAFRAPARALLVLERQARVTSDYAYGLSGPENLHRRRR